MVAGCTDGASGTDMHPAVTRRENMRAIKTLTVPFIILFNASSGFMFLSSGFLLHYAIIVKILSDYPSHDKMDPEFRILKKS
ncbi:MAG: hypothetical protein WC626_01740 [Methanoregula sp.]